MSIRDFGVCVCAVSTSELSGQHLELADNGDILGVPANVKGFHLTMGIPDGSRTVAVQKDIATVMGGHHTAGVEKIHHACGKKMTYFALTKAIEVRRGGENAWTNWKGRFSNHLDLFTFGPDGSVALNHVGVLSPDGGTTWRLHMEPRFRGQVFLNGGGYVVKPDEVKWGSFGTREEILSHSVARSLLASAHIQPWTGKPRELDPMIPPHLPGEAVVKFYSVFSGQCGQGIAYLCGGREEAWVLAQDLRTVPDEDGIKRLFFGQRLTYNALATFGQSNKLVGVELANDDDPE